MAGCDEPVAPRKLLEARLEVAVPELDDAVAARADEMVVVLVGADAVAELARVVAQGVDDAPLAQRGQRAVDGREADVVAVGADALVELLRRHVVALLHELGEHGEALPCRPEPAAFEEQPGSLSDRLSSLHPAGILALMVTRTILILAGLAVACGLTACGRSAKEESSRGRLQVVAGFYPLAFAVQLLGGNAVDVRNLTPPGAEPHDFELSPRDVEEVRSAGLVLYLGDGFQPALEQAVKSTGVRAVDLLDGLPLRGKDPHVWLDPLLYAQIAERIASELGRPEAAAGMVSELRALDGEYRRGLAGCSRRELVTSHEAFAYLAARYGLEQIAVAGLAPEAEPAPGDLERTVDEVRRTGATTVYTEPLVSPRIAATVAREAGARTAVLNPLEGLTRDELAGGADYFSVMRANLAALRKGLGCR